jgi:glycosyltransferase involved in cell wall biosynthesis
MNYRQARIKITIEQIIIYPLILLGKLLGLLFPLRHKSPFFLFFPSDTIGGATKVNADILSLLAPHRPTVIFSKKYANRGFAKLFTLPGVHIIDLRDKIDNKALHFINMIYRGILSAWINRSGAKVVFGGEAIYFYKVIPYLKKDIKVVELCHLNTWFNYSQAFIPYMDVRITSTPKIRRDLERQYEQNGVPARYAERITFIDNWVDIPPKPRDTHEGLNILFVGRGALQKRVHLISRIAERIFETGLEIRFTFVGDVSELVSEKVKQQAKIYEYVEDKQLLYSLYDQSDILILTSAYEGLPIVVMDMMVRGKVVLSTAVDGIPDYIEHKKTGLLIDELHREDEIVEKGVTLILEMYRDREQMRAIGDRVFHFARERFPKAHFDAQYRRIFGLEDA